MAGGTPWYIDEAARHDPAVARMLAYASVEGAEGVFVPGHLAVRSLVTPGAKVRVAPGAFSILNTAVGGEFEAYVGKFSTEIEVDVSPTDSNPAGRTDLVIARVENPYPGGTGTGSWPIPADPEQDPYWHVRVIEGVSPTYIQTVRSWNVDWSAITLARIKRPANTGVVEQSHITDLRSLVSLKSERLVIITEPPSTPPPIAYDIYSESSKCEPSGTNQLATNQTAYKKFPDDVTWKVPIPSWAKGMDVRVDFNPQVADGQVWGDARLVVEGETTNAAPTMFDLNWNGGGYGPIQAPINVYGTESLQPSACGRVKNMWIEMRMLDPANHDGHLEISAGTYASLLVVFKRYPVYD